MFGSDRPFEGLYVYKLLAAKCNVPRDLIHGVDDVAILNYGMLARLPGIDSHPQQWSGHRLATTTCENGRGLTYRYISSDVVSIDHHQTVRKAWSVGYSPFVPAIVWRTKNSVRPKPFALTRWSRCTVVEHLPFHVVRHPNERRALRSRVVEIGMSPKLYTDDERVICLCFSYRNKAGFESDVVGPVHRKRPSGP
jgi:hypothetical protein